MLCHYDNLSSLCTGVVCKSDGLRLFSTLVLQCTLSSSEEVDQQGFLPQSTMFCCKCCYLLTRISGNPGPMKAAPCLFCREVTQLSSLCWIFTYASPFALGAHDARLVGSNTTNSASPSIAPCLRLSSFHLGPASTCNAESLNNSTASNVIWQPWLRKLALQSISESRAANDPLSTCDVLLPDNCSSRTGLEGWSLERTRAPTLGKLTYGCGPNTAPKMFRQLLADKALRYEPTLLHYSDLFWRDLHYREEGPTTKQTHGHGGWCHLWSLERLFVDMYTYLYTRKYKILTVLGGLKGPSSNLVTPAQVLVTQSGPRRRGHTKRGIWKGKQEDRGEKALKTHSLLSLVQRSLPTYIYLYIYTHTYIYMGSISGPHLPLHRVNKWSTFTIPQNNKTTK